MTTNGNKWQHITTNKKYARNPEKRRKGEGQKWRRRAPSALPGAARRPLHVWEPGGGGADPSHRPRLKVKKKNRLRPFEHDQGSSLGP